MHARRCGTAAPADALAPTPPPLRDEPTIAGSSLSRLPGPRAWPLLGNLPDLDTQRLHVRLEQWTRDFGPTYRVRLGRREALVVARPDWISRILRDRPDGWRRLQSMQAVIRESGAHGVFSAEGDDWRRQRRLVMGAFDPGHLKRYFPRLVRDTARLRLSRSAPPRPAGPATSGRPTTRRAPAGRRPPHWPRSRPASRPPAAR